MGIQFGLGLAAGGVSFWKREELLELFFSSRPHLDLNHNPLLLCFFLSIDYCLSVELI